MKFKILPTAQQANEKIKRERGSEKERGVNLGQWSQNTGMQA